MNVLVAGIGNIFLSDDGFGVEVVRHLDSSCVPEGVKVADFGIRGVHLSFELLEGYDALVLVDAMPMGSQPGTVAIFEPDLETVEPSAMDAHSMNPAVVLGLLAGMGGYVPRVVVVGCEPLTTDEGIGLSAPVSAAVAPAVETVCQLLTEICSTDKEKLPS